MLILFLQVLDFFLSPDCRANSTSKRVLSPIRIAEHAPEQSPERLPVRTSRAHGELTIQLATQALMCRPMSSWLQLQIPRSHSTLILRGTWVLGYVVYASIVTREACFFDRGVWTKCDSWDLESIPFWLYALDAVMLWCFSLRLLFRCLLIRRLTDGRSRGVAILLLQLPLGLLCWQAFWKQIHRAGGGSIVHASLQMGWLHMLLFARSRTVEVAALHKYSLPFLLRVLLVFKALAF